MCCSYVHFGTARAVPLQDSSPNPDPSPADRGKSFISEIGMRRAFAQQCSEMGFYAETQDLSSRGGYQGGQLQLSIYRHWGSGIRLVCHPVEAAHLALWWFWLLWYDEDKVWGWWVGALQRFGCDLR